MNDFLNFLEMVSKRLDNIDVERILRKYLCNLEDRLKNIIAINFYNTKHYF